MLKRIFILILFLHLFSLGLLAQVTFGRKHGVYRNGISVTIKSSTPGAEIRYTTDGSKPDGNSQLYTKPVIVSKTTILRATEVVEGVADTNCVTSSYIYPHSVLAQPNNPEGYPATWGKYCEISGTAPADYEMDPEITSDATASAAISASMNELPILSLVSERDNFFSHEKDPETGGIYIYTGAPVGNGTGRGWERPVSVELMGGPQEHNLSTNCVIELHGGHGRLAEKNPKHSFRLTFKTGFGPSKLFYSVFGPEGPDEFNALVLRSFFGNSWQHWNNSYRQRAQYTRDLWARRMQQKMGHPWADGLYVHLFINGLYWGIYNIAERVDDSYCKTHFGGKKSDYDVIKVEEVGGSHVVEAADGNLEKWNKMVSLTARATENKYYFMLQGMDENGMPCDTLEPLLDIDGFIDYMLINQYAGNNDWDSHNWFAFRSRTRADKGFQFICWDSEQIFEGAGDSNLGTNNSGRPTGIFNRLMKNKIFQRRYIDRSCQLLTGNGLLTEKNVVALWDSLYHTISSSLYAESARWGDYRRDVHPYSSEGSLYTVQNYYMRERRRLLNEYFPVRSNQLLSKLKQKGWYPNVQAPGFLVNGESLYKDTLNLDDVLTLNAPGTIYYTIDGSEPVSWLRDSNGAPTPDAIRYDGSNLIDLLPQEGGKVTVRAIHYASTTWSPAIQYTFYLVPPTAVNGVMASLPEDRAVYDLSGRKIASSWNESLPRGIYVVNKKVRIKP